VVVTAAHTIRREGEATIMLADGQTVTGTPAGRDAVTDLAVYRIPDSAGPAAEFAPAGSAKVGQIVIQVGRVGNEGPSATVGVIHAIRNRWRTLRGAEVDKIYQLDLPVRDGFSGSPLLDAAGRVLGLASSGLARGRAAALPTAAVDRVVEMLLAKGRIPRGYLGIGLQELAVPQEKRRALIVMSVDPEGPAGKAGVVLGDILLRGEEVSLTSIWDLATLLTPDKVGASVGFELLRGGKSTQMRVTVGERPGV
jgi:S1-C subfamily serine protease